MHVTKIHKYNIIIMYVNLTRFVLFYYIFFGPTTEGKMGLELEISGSFVRFTDGRQLLIIVSSSSYKTNLRCRPGVVDVSSRGSQNKYDLI